MNKKMANLNKYKSFILLSFCLAFTVSLQPAHATITSITLSGPSTLVCNGPHGTYTVTIMGNSQYGTGLLWSVYDEDPIVDDCLKDEVLILGGETAEPPWTITRIFELWCEGEDCPSCYVTGSYGYSGEGCNGDPAEVFVHIETWTGGNLGISNILEVSCIPEPTTVAVLGLGGLALLRKRRA